MIQLFFAAKFPENNNFQDFLFIIIKNIRFVNPKENMQRPLDFSAVKDKNVTIFLRKPLDKPEKIGYNNKAYFNFIFGGCEIQHGEVLKW